MLSEVLSRLTFCGRVSQEGPAEGGWERGVRGGGYPPGTRRACASGGGGGPRGGRTGRSGASGEVARVWRGRRREGSSVQGSLSAQARLVAQGREEHRARASAYHLRVERVMRCARAGVGARGKGREGTVCRGSGGVWSAPAGARLAVLAGGDSDRKYRARVAPCVAPRRNPRLTRQRKAPPKRGCAGTSEMGRAGFEPATLGLKEASGGFGASRFPWKIAGF